MNLPKSITRHTGGVALGDTSTTSSSASRAIWRACFIETTPMFSPLGPIKRTSGTRMPSFTRKSLALISFSYLHDKSSHRLVLSGRMIPCAAGIVNKIDRGRSNILRRPRSGSILQLRCPSGNPVRGTREELAQRTVVLLAPVAYSERHLLRLHLILPNHEHVRHLH